MPASAWQKLWPDGRGLLNGNHLNRIFTGASKTQAQEIGTLIVDTSFTNNGTTNVAGATVNGRQALTAAGSTQLGAAAIATTISLAIITVATTASTHGVRLPAAVTGKEVTVGNAGTFGVKVYPSTNGKIGAASTNSADSTVLAVNKANTYYAVNKTLWIVARGA